MGGWRYIAQELDGNGGETWISGDLPLTKPKLTRVLSGPHQIVADAIGPGPRLAVERFKRWKTTIYAEDPSGRLFVGGILVDYDIDGSTITLDVSGFTTYAKGIPYDGEYSGVAVDPLDVTRDIWQHVQGQAASNIGLELDTLTTGQAIGTPADPNATATTGPYLLNYWSTDDAGGKVDDLAKNTPFDYLEEHYWDGDVIRHQLRFGYPSIGTRRDRLRFVLGENVFKMPTETYASDEVVTEVWVFGSGEGRDRIRGTAKFVPVNSVRRVKIIDDKTITNQSDADQRASDELSLYAPERDVAGISELVIRNHSHAPIGSYDVGDEIPYSGDHEWGSINVWVKILKLTASPEDGDDLVATVARTDTIR